MTIKKANQLIEGFLGHMKDDGDFTKMMHALTSNGLNLMDGEIEYSPDMTNKHYFFRLVADKFNDDGSWEEGKTIGYLSAYKCFVRGIDNPYEILAYVS